MTITLPPELEQEVVERSSELGINPQDLVQRAVSWYVQADPELAAELKFWQQLGWESLAKVEAALE